MHLGAFCLFSLFFRVEGSSEWTFLFILEFGEGSKENKEDFQFFVYSGQVFALLFLRDSHLDGLMHVTLLGVWGCGFAIIAFCCKREVG